MKHGEVREKDERPQARREGIPAVWYENPSHQIAVPEDTGGKTQAVETAAIDHRSVRERISGIMFLSTLSVKQRGSCRYMLAVLIAWFLGYAVTGAASTTTYSYTGASQTFVVPAGVTAIIVDVAGAQGGTANAGVGTGGNGGRVQTTLSVTPGETLDVYVGGAGGLPSGGFNGGGTGGASAGGGGGASDIRRSGTRLAVAGGGGGASAFGGPNSNGGAGGGILGAAGLLNGASSGFAGNGGTPTAGGAGGTPGGGAGASGTGGAGASMGAGGGGGGYFGGGGAGSNGSSAGGGGGGSGFSSGSSTTLTQGYRSGNGGISITTVDTTAPNAVAITPADSGPTNAGTISFTVDFDEDVQGFNDASDLVISHSGTLHGSTVVTGGPASYTVTLNGVAGDGNITLAADLASDIEDLAGNPLASSVTSGTVSIDNTPPGAILSAPSALATASGPVSYLLSYTGAETITLSETDVVLHATGDASGEVSISGSGSTERTIVINNISGNGSLAVSVAAGTASDAAGNSAASVAMGSSFLVDNTAIVVGIGTPSVLLTRGGPVAFSVIYENVTTVSLGSGDVTVVSTGTASADAEVSVAKAEGNLERTVTLNNIAGDGTLAIVIASGTATDNLSNPAPAAGPSASIAVDNTAPIVTVSSLTTADPSPALSGAVDDPAATISVTVDGQMLPAANPGGGMWTLAGGAIDSLAEGTYDVAVTATDAAGNAGMDGTLGELTILFAIQGAGAIQASLNPGFIEAGATLNLTAPGGFFDYQWLKDSVFLLEEAPRVTGVQSQVLQFNPVLESDAGIYTCRYDDGTKALVETAPYYLDVLPGGSLPMGGVLGLLAAALGLVTAGTRKLRQRP